MTGCDTTLAPYGRGKVSFLNLMSKSKELREISTTMYDIWAEKEEIGKASIPTFILMYGWNQNDNLTSLR